MREPALNIVEHEVWLLTVRIQANKWIQVSQKMLSARFQPTRNPPKDQRHTYFHFAGFASFIGIMIKQ
jgi:hypothetical protein